MCTPVHYEQTVRFIGIWQALLLGYEDHIDVYLNITNLGATDSLDLSAVTLLIEYPYTVW